MSRSIAISGAVLLSLVAVAVFARAAADDSEALPNDLAEYEHINSIVVPNQESPVTGFHHFYMNDTGLEIFRKSEARRQYPAGTVIVGKVYCVKKTEDGAYNEGDLAAYTLMRKDPDDPKTEDTGGWHFVKLDSSGNRIKINEVEACFRCHQPHEAADFVISHPLK